MSTNLWTQRGGDGGHTAYVDIAVNAAAITDAWNQPLNYTSSGFWAQNGNRGVAIDGTQVYRTDLEGYWANGNYHVIAYDLATGTQVWNKIIVGNGPVSAPSVANGLVYINRSGHSGISGGGPGELPRLYGLSAQTGTITVQTTYGAQWDSDERPAIDNNQLVAWDGYYGGFSAWTASTLVRQWNNTGSIYDPPLAAFGSQYLYAYGNKVYQRTNGAFVQNITPPTGFPWVADPMVSGSGKVLFEVRNDQYYPSTYALSAYDGTTLTPLWTKTLPNPARGKAVGNGIVVVTAGTQLFILDEATGAELGTWTAPAGMNPTEEIVLTRSHVFVQTSANYIAKMHAVNLTTAQEEWSFTNTITGEGAAYMDIAFGGGYLLLSNDAFVRAFNVSAGPPNNPPDAVNDSQTTAEDTSATINVLANDTDGDGDTLTVTTVGAPAHGTATLDSNVATVTITINTIFGDSGDDSIDTEGSSANNVLLGGKGNDVIQAGRGRDILIGGEGVDELAGGSGDDILIGARTDHDNNLTALLALLAEWSRTDLAYAGRISHLTGATGGGLNGGALLNAATVHDDAAIDYLFGENGQDWFLYQASGAFADDLDDKGSNETATPI